MREKRGTKETGQLGEDIACKHLVRNGFKILERNYRCKIGEIDIVALKDEVVHFVEVKALSCGALPHINTARDAYRPEEQVHPAKLHKLARLAEMYVMQRKERREYQIDALGVLMDKNKRIARCRLFEQVL